MNLTYNTETTRFFLSGEYISRRDLPNMSSTPASTTTAHPVFANPGEKSRATRFIFEVGLDWRPTEADTISFSSIYDRSHHND